DHDAAPSLQGFLNELRSGDVEIKRDMEQRRDEVRIMTVHGAKGLEAPIVFLPDTCSMARNQGPRLYPLSADDASHL
ncbi:3'-5' exonuclease, partial [Salmonella sp. SAL4431]|uniref:3'-5' exonuclease n=1 Tax=Salmonella sp. SAL4431 TaxID=3159886 RepID=UPI00397D69D0